MNVPISPTAAASPLPALLPIASFWRRLAAWVLDMLLLIVTGYTLGFAFSDTWYRIGPYGRFVGLAIVLLYFGLLNSRIGKGQTFGKGIAGIAVRDQEGRPIGLGCSLLRITILAVPTILSGWALPVFQVGIVSWLVTTICFGVGGALAYTIVFNRGTRQEFHDLLLGTYVVHLAGKPIEKYPRAAKVHRTISFVLIGAVALGAGILMLLKPYPPEANATRTFRLYQMLQADPRFFTVKVGDRLSVNGKNTTHSLVVEVWLKGPPSPHEQIRLVSELWQAALSSGDDLQDLDEVIVKVTSSIDLGIARWNDSYSDAWSPRPFK